jgi:hypothetical protein
MTYNLAECLALDEGDFEVLPLLLFLLLLFSYFNLSSFVTSLTSSTTFGPVFVFVLSLNEKMVFPSDWLAVPVSQG